MIDLFLKGGFVMYPILLCSIVMVYFSIERAIYLRRVRGDTGEFMNIVNGFLTRNALDEAHAYCESNSGILSNIIKAGLKNQKLGREEVIRAIESAGSVEVAKLERGILILQTVAKIAPLLGLYGTVTGMIRSFSSVSSGGDPLGLAAGISEALITTAAGLTVAIPAYFLSYYYLNRVNKFTLDMQTNSISVLDTLATLEESVAERSQRLDTIGGEYLEV